MITNVATALIGLGDMWIVGRMGDTAAQGAVDVGARLFALLFTAMNFLKTGTTGLVAQAGTREGDTAQVGVLVRGLFVGLTIGLLLLLFKPVLLPLLLSALGAEGDVLAAAGTYAGIRYWTAPGVMCNLALVGFMVGRRQMRAVLLIEVAYNLANVGLGLWFVLSLDWGIAGIGWSSLIAEYTKLAVIAAFLRRDAVFTRVGRLRLDAALIGWQAVRPFLSVNRDLFLRTIVLMVALAALTRLSAERGDAVLAANGILYQLFVLTALLLDGFENAAQVLNGERFGERDAAGFRHYIRAIILRGLAVALAVSAVFIILGKPIIASFAATPAVLDAAYEVWPWLLAFPVAGVLGFIFDGVYVAASWTRALLVSMIGASLLYAVSLWLTWPLGSNGLWISFTLFLLARAAIQAVMLRRLSSRIA
ncbi:MATE family efflux transporter [Altererythrobacter aurantiacus]|uniref:MATE family efflux transporter n=1 Tax=Parapontixanthobacter aurantiacus TaxID=1463599 RepID=A0A844ZBM7_9SPHN|nr:MATE family efflux transporter [Parapontixanthobacter aurantiacus]MXO84914.1 MATE family efflux transporter [Parapontixanthobacter aurantiacus]